METKQYINQFNEIINQCANAYIRRSETYDEAIRLMVADEVSEKEDNESFYVLVAKEIKQRALKDKISTNN